MKTAKETIITRKKNGQQKELFGRTFKIVKNGLDEDEIVSFLGGLIEQNTDLVAKLENLDSLNKLAENTVIEAQNEAERIRSEIEQNAKDMASAIISEAKAAAEKNATERIEETERIAETIKASAEEEANRINAEAIQKAEELAIEIRANAQKETENALRAKREQLRKYYKQVHKELVANLDNFVEITNPSTRSVSVELQGVKQAQPVVEPVKIILPQNRFVASFLQYFLRLFKMLARWLKSGSLLVTRILQPGIRRGRKAASRLKERLPRIRLTY
jgi:vacuolar-type H+-ATPase subunit E/Vma4